MQPSSTDKAYNASESFREKNRLITVGIGSDMVGSFLRKIASSKNDFFLAECPEDILDAFKSVAHRLFSYSKKNGSVKNLPGSKSPSTMNAKAVVESGDSDNWDNVQNDETEVA